MGRQQLQTNPGVLTPKGHLVNQNKQGSLDQHKDKNTSPKKISQTGGTQTTPPPSPKRSTLTGETQTTPLQNNIQDQSPGPTRLQSH